MIVCYSYLIAVFVRSLQAVHNALLFFFILPGRKQAPVTKTGFSFVHLMIRTVI